jgi:hypothetical protein
MRQFAILEKTRDHPDRLTARRQHRIRHRTHQPDARASVYERHAAGRHEGAEGGRGRREGRIMARS